MGKEEGTKMAEMPAAEISECEAAPAEAPSNTSEAAEDPSSLAHQDKLAQNKFKGVDKNPVAAFNRRVTDLRKHNSHHVDTTRTTLTMSNY